MSAGQVHALVAAGLRDPRLLARWKRQPGEIGRHDRQAVSLDVDAVLRFAGLTSKVRHNGVRGDYPLTFRMLRFAGIEVELFAAYALHCARAGRAFAPSPARRGIELAAFILEWTNEHGYVDSRLTDIVRHETAVALLRANQVPVAEPVTATPQGIQSSAVPAIRGALVLEEFESDPFEIGAALNRQNPSLNEIPVAATMLGYWLSPDADRIRILRLDAFSFHFLRRVDGRSSLAALARALSLAPTQRFLDAAMELQRLGLLGFQAREQTP